MKKLFLQPIGESALVTTGSPVLTALLAKDMRVLMSCGGKGICSTCHVKVCEGADQLSPISSKERRTLALVADSTPESRLACQAQVYGDGVVVRVPEGMYIEKAEDLRSLLGTAAPENILHPITGMLLIPKGKLITRSLLDQSRQVEKDLQQLQEGDTTHAAQKTQFSASGIATRPSLSAVTKLPASRPMPAPPPVRKPPVEPPQPVKMETSKPEHTRPARKTMPASRKPAPTPTAKFSQSSSGFFNSVQSQAKFQTTSRFKREKLEASVKASRPVEAARAGVQIDKYLLLELVGKGGAGVVYRALHTKLKTLVAVKFLRTDTGSASGADLEHLAHEAQLLAQLAHPNVVRVIDFEDHPTRPYVVMEFVDGLTAADLVKQSGRIAPSRALDIALDVASGLEAAWKLGIVHRDVKPGNILVTRAGMSKLVDLGLATVSRHDAPRDSGRIPVEGTVGYMAPEVINGDKVDHRSDMYALGATLFHLMAGRLPFIGRSSNELVLQHLQMPAPDLHELVGEVPLPIAALIAKLMAKSPEERFDDYSELIAELNAIKHDIAENAAEAVAGR